MENITDKKIDTLFKTLAENKYPYVISNAKMLKLMYPEINWTSGMIVNMKNNLKIFCTDGVKEDKVYTNLNIETEEI